MPAALPPPGRCSTPAPGEPSAAPGDEGLGIDKQLLSEPLVDAVAHCAAGCVLAVDALVSSCRSPVVVSVITGLGRTVLITAAAHYVLFQVALWPLRLLSWLLWVLSLTLVRVDVGSLVNSSMAIYPLVTMALTRTVYRSAADGCFQGTLERIDPKLAAHLAAKPRRYRASLAQKLLSRLGLSWQDREDVTTVLLTMLAGMLLRNWRRRLPRIGFLVAPVVQFLGIRYMVGRPAAAAVLSLAAALHPQLEGPVMAFVELWASSKLLGRSSCRYFLERQVPRDKWGAFIRAFEYTFVSYFLLPTALMRVPVLGALVAFPSAAVGAYALQDVLSRSRGLADALDHLQ